MWLPAIARLVFLSQAVPFSPVKLLSQAWEKKMGLKSVNEPYSFPWTLCHWKRSVLCFRDVSGNWSSFEPWLNTGLGLLPRFSGTH